MPANGSSAWLRIGAVTVVVALSMLVGACARSTTASSGASTGLVVPTPGATGATGAGSGSAAGSVDLQSGTAVSAAPSNTGADASAVPAQQSLVIVDKTLRIETGDVQATLARIRDLTTRAGGDVASLEVSTASGQPVYPVPLNGASGSDSGASSTPLSAYVTVRVPASAYQAFVASATVLGRVLYQSESAQDVTQQHVDLKARLDNLKAEEARLRQFFAKAKTVSDMLAIEQELSRVQGDIESMQAQVTYLEDQAAMATVTIELTEPQAIVSPAGIDWGTKNTLTDSVRAFVDTLNGLIVVLGPVLAVLVFVGLPVWLVVWVIRRAMHRRRAARAAETPAGIPSASEGAEERHAS
jgi:hypothetical protein